MECAEGIFLPTPEFAAFRVSVPPEPDDDQSVKRWVGLSLKRSGGQIIQCLDVVLLEANFGGYKELHVDVIGVEAKLYQQLFPLHIQRYKEQFKP